MPENFIRVLMGVIRQAIRAVPSVRYALGVVGIAASAALVYGLLGRDPRIAVFGPLALLMLMVLLLLFAKLAAQTRIPSLRAALLVMIWMPLILAFGTLLLTATSVFFGKPLDLRHWLTGNVTVAPATPPPLVHKEVQDLPDVINAYQHITLKPKTKDGKVAVTRHVKVEQNGILQIEPGVTLEFARDVGIFCEGVMIARGTETHPIRFRAADPTLPWGHVALYAPPGGESFFSHCEFERGSGASYFEPSPISSEDESAFKPASARPRVGGALLLFGVSSITLEQCRFIKCQAAKAGAIYLRGSQAYISGCEFHGNTVTSPGGRGGGGAIYAQIPSSH